MLPSLLKLVWKTQKPHLKRKSLFISLIQRNSIFTVKLVKWSWQYQVLFTYFPISYLCLTLSTRIIGGYIWILLDITYLIIDRRIFSIEKHNKNLQCNWERRSENSKILFSFKIHFQKANTYKSLFWNVVCWLQWNIDVPTTKCLPFVRGRITKSDLYESSLFFTSQYRSIYL